MFFRHVTSPICLLVQAIEILLTSEAWWHALYSIVCFWYLIPFHCPGVQDPGWNVLPVLVGSLVELASDLNEGADAWSTAVSNWPSNINVPSTSKLFVVGWLPWTLDGPPAPWPSAEWSMVMCCYASLVSRCPSPSCLHVVWKRSLILSSCLWYFFLSRDLPVYFSVRCWREKH